MGAMKVLNVKQREVVVAAYHAGGKVEMVRNENTLRALRARGWVKRPDEAESSLRLGDVRTTPAAFGVEFVLTAQATTAIAEYLKSTD